MKTLDSDGAAQFLGLSKQKTMELARKGEFPAISWGNGWTFIQEELEDWLRKTALAQQTERINRLLDNPNPAPTRGKNAKGRKPLVDVGA
jgi:excisionase family DNA binding protein